MYFVQRNEQVCGAEAHTGALWKMKATKDAGEMYCDPMCEDNIKGRNKTGSTLWEEHLRDPLVALDKALRLP